jgi:RNA methyltransferase, TrmH family
MATLNSRSNPKIKQVRQLLGQRKERERSGLFVAEGIRHVGEAVEAQARVEYICYAPDILTSDFAYKLIDEQSQREIPCYAVDKDTFTGMAGKENPQGILAVIRIPHSKLDSLSVREFPWSVALVAPQDPGNIGAILRTIDAVGASGLLLLDDPSSNQYSADPYHPSSVRASMGSIFWYPLITADFSEFVHWVRANGIKVYGTSAHATQDYRQVGRFERPLVLLLGSEREGLTPAQSAVCDMLLKIPMQGRVTSLNLAIATGLMLYTISDRME